jgi:hypothetical protein
MADSTTSKSSDDNINRITDLWRARDAVDAQLQVRLGQPIPSKELQDAFTAVTGALNATTTTGTTATAAAGANSATTAADAILKAATTYYQSVAAVRALDQLKQALGRWEHIIPRTPVDDAKETFETRLKELGIRRKEVEKHEKALDDEINEVKAELSSLGIKI